MEFRRQQEEQNVPNISALAFFGGEGIVVGILILAYIYYHRQRQRQERQRQTDPVTETESS